MKKIFVILVLFICPFAFAEHMTFKGISMGLPYSEFKIKLIESGMTFVKKENSTASDIHMFKGSFAGQRDCEIWVSVAKDGIMVGKVSVWFPEVSTWSSIKSDYDNLYASLSNKYGNPENDYHFFKSPYYDGDGYEMQALRLEKCFYAAFWKIDENSVGLEITKYEQIKLSYEDAENMNIIVNAKESAIQNDL